VIKNVAKLFVLISLIAAYMACADSQIAMALVEPFNASKHEICNWVNDRPALGLVGVAMIVSAMSVLFAYLFKD